MASYERDFKFWFSVASFAAANPSYVFRRPLFNLKRCFADRLAQLGYYNYPYKIIFLAGMALGGTTWMKNLLGRIPGYHTRRTPMPHEIAYYQNICDSAFGRVPKHGYTLFKTHLNPTPENLECIFRNGVEKILVTYRDLRDVTVSRYHRLMDFPKPRKMSDFMDYREMGREKAMSHSIEVGAAYISWVRGWIEIKNKYPERVHIETFEDLKKDTKGTFKRVLDFYKIELSDKRIDEIIEAAKGRGDGKKNKYASILMPSAYSSTFRSGKIGNWREELTDTEIEKCRKVLGPVLIELGYEKDMSW